MSSTSFPAFALSADAFVAVEAIEAARGPSEILDVLAQSLAPFGLTSLIATGLPPTQDELEAQILLNGLPQAWYGSYMQEGYYRDDPCARHCLNTRHPFSWSEIPPVLHDTPRAKRIFGHAADFGLRDGVCVPVHGPSGVGGVGAAGDKIDLSPEARRVVHFVALYAYNAAERSHRVQANVAPVFVLSKREREVLSWLAEGKTMQDVGDLLGLSNHTIVQHLRNIRRKLRTSNTTHSIVEAIRRRELRL